MKRPAAASDRSRFIDWPALKDIGARLDALVAAGALTADNWADLLAEGRRATHGDDDPLEFLFNEAGDAW